MGLDMFLLKEVYIGGQYSFNEVKGTIDLTVHGEQIDIPLNKLNSITLDVAYWRKANQVHNWFVNNVQDGNDDCGTYHVYGDKLKELVKLCKRILKLKETSLELAVQEAEDLLPTCSGFFFGDTNYDEYYFEQLQDTIDQLKDVKDDETFIYHSSW